MRRFLVFMLEGRPCGDASLARVCPLRRIVAGGKVGMLGWAHDGTNRSCYQNPNFANW